MSIFEFYIFDIKLYLNTLNGDIADDLGEIVSNHFEIRRDESEKYFNPTSYSFCLNISDACNLKCSYCFNNKKQNRFMEVDEAIKACDLFFDFFPNAEKYYIDLSGKGEPLLNKDVIKAVAIYCRKKSDELKREVLPMLVCNGTLLTKDNVKFLQDLGVLFGVSLDGPKTIHDLFRKDSSGKGTFNRVIKNILNIEHREYVGCAATLTNVVFPLCDTIEYLSKIFNTLSFRLCRSYKYGLSKDSLELWKAEYLKLTEKLRLDIDTSNFKIFKCLMNGDDLFGRYLYRMFGNSRAINRCDCSITRFTYDINGKIYGCPASSNISSFEVLKNEIYDKQKEKFIKQVYECWECPFKFYCGGECELETKFYGHINKYNCEFKISLIKLAAYLKIYCLRSNINMYIELNRFCEEKKSRNRIDVELKLFCKNHPELSFSEAKVEFDNINKRY